MADVFLSYKTEDRARVRPLVQALVAEGLTVWWDQHIEGGAAWREQIQSELDAAACVLVVWSTLSVGPLGRFVQDEASRADRRGVYLPIAIDDVHPPLGFGQHQVIDLVGWRSARRDPRFVSLLGAIRAVMVREPAAIAPARRPSPDRLSWRWIAAGIAAVILVAGVVLLKAPTRLCAAAGLTCAGAQAKAAPNSLAVLPFANLSGDPAQDYFSDGLTDELISRLSRLTGLQIAARASSFKFKGAKADTRAIGGQLGVAYLLDGSVRRDGNLVRVSAQLSEARSGFERWSQTYDRNMDDIFAVQSGIAEAVAQALKVKLFGADIAALSHGGTDNPAAYDAYLRGRGLFNLGGDEASYRGALAKFDAAISADPAFAAAHAARARTLLAIANQFEGPAGVRAAYDAALISARRAVSLAPALPEAQTTLAETLVYAALDMAGAKAAYDRALQAGGGDADVLLRYGLFNAQTGDANAGLQAIQRAVGLDRLDPRAYRTLGLALIAARRYPEAVDAMRQALALSPAATGAHAAIGEALYLSGQTEAAAAEYAREPGAWQKPTGQAIVLHKLGDQPGAERAYKALVAEGGDSNSYQEAEVLAQWGDQAGAFGALERAFKAGDSGLELMKRDPLLDPLRSDARFATLLARLGL